jgi:hypothetical protein
MGFLKDLVSYRVRRLEPLDLERVGGVSGNPAPRQHEFMELS